MRIAANGISLNVVESGSGPAILLLHGFPDSAALWRHQIPALTDAGYRVIAPDLRGFGESDRPDGVESYAMPTLVGDVLSVLNGLGVSRAAVVGHDLRSAGRWPPSPPIGSTGSLRYRSATPPVI